MPFVLSLLAPLFPLLSISKRNAMPVYTLPDAYSFTFSCIKAFQTMTSTVLCNIQDVLCNVYSLQVNPITVPSIEFIWDSLLELNRVFLYIVFKVWHLMTSYDLWAPQKTALGYCTQSGGYIYTKYEVQVTLEQQINTILHEVHPSSTFVVIMLTMKFPYLKWFNFLETPTFCQLQWSTYMQCMKFLRWPVKIKKVVIHMHNAYILSHSHTTSHAFLAFSKESQMIRQ